MDQMREARLTQISSFLVKVEAALSALPLQHADNLTNHHANAVPQTEAASVASAAEVPPVFALPEVCPGVWVREPPTDAALAVALALQACQAGARTEAEAIKQCAALDGSRPTTFDPATVFAVLKGIGLIYDPNNAPSAEPHELKPADAAPSGYTAQAVARAQALRPDLVKGSACKATTATPASAGAEAEKKTGDGSKKAESTADGSKTERAADSKAGAEKDNAGKEAPGAVVATEASAAKEQATSEASASTVASEATSTTTTSGEAPKPLVDPAPPPIAPALTATPATTPAAASAATPAAAASAAYPPQPSTALVPPPFFPPNSMHPPSSSLFPHTAAMPPSHGHMLLAPSMLPPGMLLAPGMLPPPHLPQGAAAADFSGAQMTGSGGSGTSTTTTTGADAGQQQHYFHALQAMLAQQQQQLPSSQHPRLPPGLDNAAAASAAAAAPAPRPIDASTSTLPAPVAPATGAASTALAAATTAPAAAAAPVSAPTSVPAPPLTSSAAEPLPAPAQKTEVGRKDSDGDSVMTEKPASSASSSSSSSFLPSEVQQLALEGRMEEVTSKWGESMATDSLTWLFHQASAHDSKSGLPPEVFSLAKEGRLDELAASHGAAMVELALGWCFAQSDQWQGLKDKRAKNLTPAQQNTVDHITTQVLSVRPPGLALSKSHDVFLGAARDPAMELPALQALHVQLIAQEEKLLELLCARSGVNMPPGRPKQQNAHQSNLHALPHAPCSLKRPLAPSSSSSSSALAAPLLSSSSSSSHSISSTPGASAASSRLKGFTAAQLVAKAKKRRRMSWGDQRRPSATAAVHDCPSLAVCARRHDDDDNNESGRGGGGSAWEDLHLSASSVAWSSVASQLASLSQGAHSLRVRTRSTSFFSPHVSMCAFPHLNHAHASSLPCLTSSCCSISLSRPHPAVRRLLPPQLQVGEGSCTGPGPTTKCSRPPSKNYRTTKWRRSRLPATSN